MRPVAWRSLAIAAWSVVWLACFWAFLIAGLPTEAAKTWLADRLGRDVEAAVTIDELRVAWNLVATLRRVSIVRAAPDTGFTMKLESLRIRPRWSGVHFTGDTASGGSVGGVYRSGEVTFSFRDVSFTDLTIPAIPLPPRATMTGSGRLRRATGRGTIEAEIDGVPGGPQRVRMTGGPGPAMDGKVTITVRLPSA